MLTKEEAKEFVRQLAKDTNRKLKDHQEIINDRKRFKRPKEYRLRYFFPAERVTYRFYKANYELGYFIYTEVVNGIEKGRIKVGQGPNFQPKILSSWWIPQKEAPPEEPVPLTIVRRRKPKKKGKKNATNKSRDKRTGRKVGKKNGGSNSHRRSRKGSSKRR